MNLVEIFEETLKISKKYFKVCDSKYYRVKKMNIIWSEDTVKSIFEAEGRVAALNFADEKIPGGLVWQGAITQEECLCRCSNLYLYLIKHKGDYYQDGGLVYSKNVVFFRDSNYNLCKPKKCDIITCAALGNDVLIKEKMKMVLAVARENGVDNLILGKWGCGAFGRDWEKMKKMWEEISGSSII